jgi:sugar O-acyltransferase (sialic acid O-acetyltransferase NeuD family)
MRKLAILGASGHGKVVFDTACQAGWDEVLYFDDAWPDMSVNGRWPVVGNTESLLSQEWGIGGVIVAIGNNAIRLEKTLMFRNAGFTVVSLIHPRAYIAGDVIIKPGCVVFAGAVIQPGTEMGWAGIVNTGASVDHDCILADGVHVCPGAHLAGGVVVQDRVWIGIGATVNPGLILHENSIIGAGAVVVKPVEANAVMVGNPAKKL